MDGNECTICDSPITSERGVCRKTSSCYGLMGQMHKQCAKKYYRSIYQETNDEFDLQKWIDNNHQILLRLGKNLKPSTLVGMGTKFIDNIVQYSSGIADNNLTFSSS